MTKKELEINWDEFLRAYYHQDCPGCPEGHNSFWQTIVESGEWKEWKRYNFKVFSPWIWDFAECEELGILSPQHWKKFVKFIKTLI